MMSTIPPTPPRSPTIPEPYVDDLLELWSESRQSSSKRDISFHSALSHLDIDYDSDQQSDGAMYSMDSSTNDEFLLQQLISYTGLHYTFEDSPPPTNPPSPPDHIESDPETITSNSSTTNSIDFQIDHQLHHHLLHNNNNNIKVEPGEEDGVLEEEEEEEEQSGDLLFNINNHIFNNDHSDDNEMNHNKNHHHKNNNSSSNNHHHNHHHHHNQHDDNDTDAELEEFNRYPKTEPITEEFTSHIYDSFFNMFTDEHEDPTNTSTDSHCSLDHEPLRIKVENDITEIKHDCMWAGSCEKSDQHQDMYDEIFGSSSFTQFDFNKYDDEDSIHHLRLLTPDLEDDEEEYEEEEEEDRIRVEGEEDDDEEEIEMEQVVEEEYEDDDYYTRAPLNSIALSDHSYAFNGIGPIQQHSPLSLSAQALQLSSAQQQSFSSSSHSNNSTHAIQGIVIKEEISEESATKKTKILVPLKDLMETLQQKSFLVAPLGPGKKVIRLTGNGETVKKVLDFKGAQFKSTSMSASSFAACTSASASNLLSSSSSTLLSGSSSLSGKLMNRNNTINNNNNNNKPPSKKMKKAIHKPKQELAPSSPIHNSLSSISSSSSSSHSSSNSSNSSNSNNNGKPKKAKTHNNMERMRRIDLRNSFDTLKKLVPPLNKAAKCSKVEILKRASEYINALKSVEKRLLREEHNLRVKNEHLRNKAALLTSSN